MPIPKVRKNDRSRTKKGRWRKKRSDTGKKRSIHSNDTRILSRCTDSITNIKTVQFHNLVGDKDMDTKYLIEELINNPDKVYAKLLTDLKNTFKDDEMYTGRFIRQCLDNLIARIK